MKKIIDLYPEYPNEWLYRDLGDDNRQFEPSVSIRFDDLDLWHECTNEEKEEWERNHSGEDSSDDIL